MGRVIGLGVGRKILGQEGKDIGQGDFSGAIPVQFHHQLLGFRFGQFKELDQPLHLGRIDRSPLVGIEQPEGGLKAQALVAQKHREQ
jgi:hypothetical protein